MEKKKIRTMVSQHSFHVGIAAQVGIAGAVLFEFILRWTDRSAAMGENLHDGYYWACNSIAAFMVQFPYLTKEQIRTAIRKLIDAELVITGRFNDDPRDRTLWYAVTEKGHDIMARG